MAPDIQFTLVVFVVLVIVIITIITTTILARQWSSVHFKEMLLSP